MQCIITEKRSNKSNTLCNDETKKMASDSQIVRAKENIMLSFEGSSQRQASGTNQRI